MRLQQSLIALFLLGAALCGAHAADNGNPQVLMKTTQGTIVLELFPEAAPKTVENFLAYVESGFYDGTIFHRVIDGFMIQGGGFTADMTRKPNRAPIVNEADNGLSNRTGTIAMARTNDPHSASSQFFINVADNRNLDFTAQTARGWGYAVFGRVVEGMEVVHAIRQVPTTRHGPFSDVPVEPVVVQQATIIQ